MSVRYWVLMSHELMNSGPRWPDGLRPVRQAEDGPGPSPDCAWWLLEDDGAPATLEGRRVELTFTRSGDRAMIGSRNPAF
jgi:hypothetical protein